MGVGGPCTGARAMDGEDRGQRNDPWQTFHTGPAALGGGELAHIRRDLLRLGLDKVDSAAAQEPRLFLSHGDGTVPTRQPGDDAQGLPRGRHGGASRGVDPTTPRWRRMCRRRQRRPQPPGSGGRGRRSPTYYRALGKGRSRTPPWLPPTRL